MWLEFLLGQILFIPLIYGSNVTVVNPIINDLNDTAPSKDISSKSKITLVTEGGAITQISSNLTLPKDNNTTLMDLDKESGKPKIRPIVARKGVKPEEFEDKEFTALNSTDIMVHQNIAKNNTMIMKSDKKILNDSRIDTSVTVDKSDIYVKNDKKPHKPTVLSYEELSGTNHNVPTIAKTSSKTIISDQIPNPNSDVVKSHIDHNQPGMIMPVIITILTVPLFAVLGYMAWKRGQEAWKNRHYKRMDFLLDGMYND